MHTSGAAHTSRSDPQLHVSGQVFGPAGRITSVHAYDDGKLVYSQKKYNDAQKKDVKIRQRSCLTVCLNVSVSRVENHLSLFGVGWLGGRYS